MKKTRGEKIFSVVNYIMLTIFALLTLMPFMNVLSKSLSSESAVVSGQVSMLPVDIQFGTYKYVFSNSQYLNSLKISILVTAIGTFLSMVATVSTAYPLSKVHLRGRKPLLLMYIFVMLFSGGLVPNYLLMRNLNLLNTIWVLILPGLIGVSNMLIVKNYFEGIPESLEEAARLDGASNFGVLFRILLPVAVPVLATISLFYAVGYWNSFFGAMMYISKPDLKPLQLYLYELIKQSQASITDAPGMDNGLNLSPESVQAATIMASTLPILMVYPFLQKYFVKGIVVGSVKG